MRLVTLLLAAALIWAFIALFSHYGDVSLTLLLTLLTEAHREGFFKNEMTFAAVTFAAAGILLPLMALFFSLKVAKLQKEEKQMRLQEVYAMLRDTAGIIEALKGLGKDDLRDLFTQVEGGLAIADAAIQAAEGVESLGDEAYVRRLGAIRSRQEALQGRLNQLHGSRDEVRSILDTVAAHLSTLQKETEQLARLTRDPDLLRQISALEQGEQQVRSDLEQLRARAAHVLQLTESLPSLQRDAGELKALTQNLREERGIDAAVKKLADTLAAVRDSLNSLERGSGGGKPLSDRVAAIVDEVEELRRSYARVLRILSNLRGIGEPGGDTADSPTVRPMTLSAAAD